MAEPVVGSVIPSDLYGFAERLTGAERAVVLGLRKRLETTVRPLLNPAWDAAELPQELVDAVRAVPA